MEIAMSLVRRLPHSARLLTLLAAVFLAAACEQKEAAEQADSAASTAHEAAPEVISIDADGNIAPFGMASRQAVKVVEPMPAAPPVPTGANSELYSIHCIACHGPDAKGVEGLGVSLVASDLVASSDERDIVAFLQVGRLPQAADNVTGVPMPAFLWMTPEQLDEVAGYLKSL
jgi:disulfide bond formation protein DsbB